MSLTIAGNIGYWVAIFSYIDVWQREDRNDKSHEAAEILKFIGIFSGCCLYNAYWFFTF